MSNGHDEGTRTSSVKTWRVTATVTVGLYTEVEASSKEEAVAAAKERMPQGFCYQCSIGHPESEWVLVGELDGEPEVDSAAVCRG